MSTIETLAMAIDAKDQITHGHIRRVQHYATRLACALGVREPAQIKAIEAASLLHDMGKLAVPEYILNKPGALTSSEFEKMKLHASVGADILSAIDFPYPVVPIVRHHESWDGTGYPDGLRGSEIPIGARILSVVDCFDALTSDRPYRPRLSDAEAIQIILDRRGSMYDPLIVDMFIEIHSQLAPPLIADLAGGRRGLSAITGNLSMSDHVASGSRLEDITASTEEMLVLYDLAQNLTGQLDLAGAADIISKHIRRIVHASTCVFYLYDEHSDELHAAHAAGDNADSFMGLRIPSGQRLTGWVAANKQTILNSDPVLDLGEVGRAIRPRLRSCLSTPLLIDTDLVGVLTVYSVHNHVFTEDHRRVIEVVARQVSQTVRHAVDFQKNRSTTLKDQLTGLPNLRHLKQFVASEMSGESGSAALSLIFLSLVLPKAIGRRFSRNASDESLNNVANTIRTSLRGADVLFKYGSNEFVVLLIQTDAEAAARVAIRISERLSEQTVLSRSSEEGPVSFALGVASAPADGISVEALVTAARLRERNATSGLPQHPPFIH